MSAEQVQVVRGGLAAACERLSVVEIAAQLGHNPTVCLDTYAHVMAEQEEGERLSAEEQIVRARLALRSTAAEPDRQLDFGDLDG